MGELQLGLGMVEAEDLSIHILSRNLKEVDKKILEGYAICWRPRNGSKSGNVLVERVIQSFELVRVIGRGNGWDLLDKPKPEPYVLAFKATRELRELRGEISNLDDVYFHLKRKEPMSEKFWTDAMKKRCQDMGKNLKKKGQSFYPSTMYAIKRLKEFEEFIYSNPEFMR